MAGTSRGRLVTAASLIAVLFFAACHNTQPARKAGKVIYQPEHARGFTVVATPTGDSVWLQVVSPTDTAEVWARVLVQPADTARATVACLSQTQLGFFHALSMEHRVVAGTYLHRLTDSLWQERYQKGLLADVTGGQSADPERLSATGARYMLTSSPDVSMPQRAGHPLFVVPFPEHLESHPLGRAEWIVAAGWLCGNPGEAARQYARIARNYRTARKEHAPSTAQQVLYGSLYEGVFYAPPGNSYMAQLLRDAGFTYTYAHRKSAGNLALQAEEVAAQLNDSLWLGLLVNAASVHMTADSLHLLAGNAPWLSSVSGSRQFYLMAGAPGFFERSATQPHLLLRDLIAIRTQNTGYKPRYFSPVHQ